MKKFLISMMERLNNTQEFLAEAQRAQREERIVMIENEISEIIIKKSIKIHKTLGPGLLESVYEGGAATLKVSLTDEPLSDENVTLTSSDTNAVSLNVSSLTFTRDNFSEPQSITVTGLRDDNTDSEAVTITATMGDFTATFIINTVEVNASVSPASGGELNAKADIVITFDNSINSSSCLLSGDLASEANQQWTATTTANDTLTLSPKSAWPVGSGKSLIVEECVIAVDEENSVPVPALNLTYDVTYSVTATAVPPSGQTINAREAITITFGESMDTASFIYSGDMAGGSAEWSTAKNANDTLTLAPNLAWPVGAGKILTIQGQSIDSDAVLTYEYSYNVTYSIAPTINPADTSTITGTESIVITFDEPMDTTSLSIAGTLINNDSANATVTWSTASETNDTVTITPANIIWPSGADLTLTINGNSAYGPAMGEISLTYTVEYVVYVSSSANSTNPGSPANPGTKTAPLDTIQGGIDYADSIYTTASVRVAAVTGGYTKDYRTDGSPVISMKNGISVYGGYVSNFSTRDTAANETIIEDASAGGGALDTPNRAAYIEASVTNSTILDGFTIIMGKGGAADDDGSNSAIFCEGSPTISNNKIQGRDQVDAGKHSIGIYIYLSAPIIKNNNIDAGWNEDNGNGDISIGIYNNGASSIIENNTIDGGMGRMTYGIYIFTVATPAPKVRNNVIYAGAGASNTNSYGIWNQNNDSEILNNTIDGGMGTISRCISISTGSPVIKNNILVNMGSNFNAYGIYENGADPASVRNNNFFQLASGLYYNDGNSITDLVTIISTGEGDSTLSGYNNLSADPIFTSSTDYHLTSSSPSSVTGGGIDGSATGENWGFNYDKDGITRTGNGSTGWSVGAYEYD